MSESSPNILGHRVLVVDDDLANREALVDLLREEGFAADAVCDGRQALAWLIRHVPQTGLILLDLMMPVMDGDSFLFAKERDLAIADVPVVVMTASGPHVCDQVTAQHRVRQCIEKPLTLASLIGAVTSCWADAAARV